MIQYTILATYTDADGNTVQHAFGRYDTKDKAYAVHDALWLKFDNYFMQHYGKDAFTIDEPTFQVIRWGNVADDYKNWAQESIEENVGNVVIIQGTTDVSS